MSHDGEVAASGQPVNDPKGKKSEDETSLVCCSRCGKVANVTQTSLLDEFVIPPYPTSSQLSFLLPDEIAEAAHTYLYAVTLFLQLDRDTFTSVSDANSRAGQQVINLLSSYVNQRMTDTPSLSTPDFDQKIFNLTFRFVSEGRDISSWIDWRFVISVTCAWYDTRQDELVTFLSRLWRRARQKMVTEFSQLRDYYIHSFEAIVLDGSNDIVPTFTGLRYMITLNNDIVDLLVDNNADFLSALYDDYQVYRVHLSDDERRALLYLFYTILVSLAYRTSMSSVAQSRKGKATAGSADTLFFEIFERLFGGYVREGAASEFIDDLNAETPFVEIITEWIQQWKGAEEAVETLTEYISKIKVEDSAEMNISAQDEVDPYNWH
jgi:hypothetical protein